MTLDVGPLSLWYKKIRQRHKKQSVAAMADWASSDLKVAASTTDFSLKNQRLARVRLAPVLDVIIAD